MAAINNLIRNTKEKYSRSNKEYKGGFVEIGDINIFPIFDPPHLMKGVRNNLLTKNLVYEIEGKRKIAKWDVDSETECDDSDGFEVESSREHTADPGLYKEVIGKLQW